MTRIASGSTSRSFLDLFYDFLALNLSSTCPIPSRTGAHAVTFYVLGAHTQVSDEQWQGNVRPDREGLDSNFLILQADPVYRQGYREPHRVPGDSFHGQGSHGKHAIPRPRCKREDSALTRIPYSYRDTFFRLEASGHGVSVTRGNPGEITTSAIRIHTNAEFGDSCARKTPSRIPLNRRGANGRPAGLPSSCTMQNAQSQQPRLRNRVLNLHCPRTPRMNESKAVKQSPKIVVKR